MALFKLEMEEMIERKVRESTIDKGKERNNYNRIVKEKEQEI